MRRPSLVIVVSPTRVAAERTILERVSPLGVGWQQDCGGTPRRSSADLGGVDDSVERDVLGEWVGVVAHPARVAMATAVMMKAMRIEVIER